VRVQHFFWPGLTWAEIAVVDEMRRARGFNFRTIVGFHTSLMRAALQMWPDDVEFALSGHVDPVYWSIFDVLGDRARSNRRYIVNRNDIQNSTRFERIQDPPRHGFQMWGVSPSYDWYRIIREADGRGLSDGAVYLEIYDNSFSSHTLRQAIRR
jgi:hypothetical protein